MKAQLTPERKKFIEKQCHCALCGSLLEIKGDVNYEFSIIREEAYCKTCEIKTRVREYTLH